MKATRSSLGVAIRLPVPLCCRTTFDPAISGIRSAKRRMGPRPGAIPVSRMTKSRAQTTELLEDTVQIEPLKKPNTHD